MSIRLEVENYRAIRSIELQLDEPGLYAVVGPNGAGKTTCLAALDFLQNTFEDSPGEALQFDGGPNLFSHITKEAPGPSRFALEIQGRRWEIKPMVGPGGLLPPVPESFAQDGQSLLKQEAGEQVFTYGDQKHSASNWCALRRVFEVFTQDREIFAPFVDVLRSFLAYNEYVIGSLREHGSSISQDTRLASDGYNAFSVLQNWHTTKPFRKRYNFVIDSLQEAFPLMFGDLDFQSAGQSIFLRFFAPHSNTPIPVYFASNGLIVGLLHLMAVCSTPKGGVIAIDEPENGLHPFAIRELLQAMDDWSQENDIKVILATHSPYILNSFHKREEHVFVIGSDQEAQLTPLAQIRDPEWLRQFMLGDLYGREFGRQEVAKTRKSGQ